MKSLSGALERLSFNMQHAFNGRIAPANRPGVSARRATLARLGLERLETRDLMSGMTLANPVSNVAPSFLPPVPPVIYNTPLVATAVSSTSINLSWSDTVVGAESVTVFEQSSMTAGGWATLAILSGDPKAYTVTDLNPDSTYSFYVSIDGLILVDSKYVSGSEQSDVASALTFPAAPVFGLSAASAVQVDVSWTPVAGAASYLVDEMVDGAWVQVGDLAPTTDSLSVNGLSPNTSYEFRVAAINLDGITWSTAQTVRTLPLHISPVPGEIVA